MKHHLCPKKIPAQTVNFKNGITLMKKLIVGIYFCRITDLIYKIEKNTERLARELMGIAQGLLSC